MRIYFGTYWSHLMYNYICIIYMDGQCFFQLYNGKKRIKERNASKGEGLVKKQNWT